MYYILDIFWDSEKSYNKEISGFDMPEVWLDYILFEGEKVDIDLPPIIYYVKEINAVPDTFPTTARDIFSPKLREIINRYSNDAIQYLPAVLKEKKTGKISEDYLVPNFLIHSDGLDFEHSDIRLDGRWVEWINKLVLDESKIKNHVIFRLKEFLSLIIVREDLVNAIIENKCTGIRFIKPEDYRP